MRIVYLFLLLLLNFSSFAQVITSRIKDDPNFATYSSNWALREKKDYMDGENIIRIENTGNKLMQLGYTARLSTVKHGLIIHKIGPDGKEIAINKIENGDRIFGPTHAASVEFRNKIFLLYFKYDDKDSMRLYISELDKKSLSFINTQFLFSYQQDNVGILKMTHALENPIMYGVSPDSTKIVMAYQNPRSELITCVFGEQLKVLRKTISKNLIPEKGVVTEAFVENSGNTVCVVSKENWTFDSNPLRGIIIQKLDGREKYQEYAGIEGNGELYNCHIRNSKDNSKVYLFGDYTGTIGKTGVWISDLESEKLRISKPSFFPYPEDLKQSIHKLGFGAKKKGDYGVRDVQYKLVEFDNGSLALCGNPLLREDNTYTEVGNHMTQGYIEYFAGPLIISYLEKNRVGRTFAMIPRNQNMSVGSDGIYVPYQEKLIVLYNDYKANITGSLNQVKVDKKGGPVVHELSLGYAVMDLNGVIKERKLIAEGVSRMNCYNTSQYRKVAENIFEVPSSSLDKKTDSYKVVEITIN